MNQNSRKLPSHANKKLSHPPLQAPVDLHIASNPLRGPFDSEPLKNAMWMTTQATPAIQIPGLRK